MSGSSAEDALAAKSRAPFDAWETSVDSYKRYIYEGRAFRADYLQVVTGSGGEKEIVLLTGSTKFVHLTTLRFSLGSTPAEFELIEDPNITATGPSVPTFNHNRQIGGSPELVLSHTPGYTGGTVIARELIPERGKTAGNFEVGATGTTGQAEMVLAQDTPYVVRVVNNGTDASEFLTTILWYELDFAA